MESSAESTITVLVTCSGLFPAASGVASYVMVYVPGVAVSTMSPPVVTIPV